MPIADVSESPLKDLVSLRDRSAAVTGGARGIGKAIASRLAEAGASVAIGDLDQDAARAAADEINDAHGSRCKGMVLDARDAGSIERFAEAAVGRTGRLDIWVNNAGIYPSTAFLEMTEDEWDAVVNVNLRGTFLASQAAARRMIQSPQRNQVILNIASVSGLRGRMRLSHYAASKHGVVGLTKSLALELAPRGIRVLSLAPTLVETPGVAAGRDSSDRAAAEYRAFTAQVAASIPLGRAALPDDVARVALFCVSDLALYLTGSTVPVDGGALA